MVLDKLGEALKNTLKKIAKAVFVDETLVNELIKDIQRALIVSDVNVKLVFELTKTIKERALKEKVPKKVAQREHLINIVYEELVRFLGEEKKEIKPFEKSLKGKDEKKKPFKIMMVGLFGSGKTTSIGKLATYYSKRGYKVAVLGLDIHRPAAIDQIEQVCEQANVKCFVEKNEKDILKIYNEFKEEYKKYDILIIDTAGRDALSKELIEEIRKLNEEIKPDEKLLVISADIGQAAQKQAEAFHENCGITGVVVSKLDGTARGGGALSACVATKAPIKFIGVGEKLNDLEEFNPKGFVGRLLGMGDLEALLEKAKEAISEEEAQDLGKKMFKGEFNFLDLFEQMKAMNKMGPLSKLLDLIPGLGGMGIPKELIGVQQEKLKKWEHILKSMTKKELEEPELIDAGRIDRIAKGAGVNTSEVRELLKQYRQTKKILKMMKGGEGKPEDMQKLMKKFKGKMPKGFKF